MPAELHDLQAVQGDVPDDLSRLPSPLARSRSLRHRRRLLAKMYIEVQRPIARTDQIAFISDARPPAHTLSPQQ